MENLVSIILPIYNGEQYMRESIESVLAQTWKNWELIIVDDCSTDSTAEIAQEYAARDSRIRYYRNETNLRLPRNLNRGFSLARGDYLTWTSDDNLYLPNAIETMVQVLERDQAEFVFASCRIIDGEGQEVEYIMVDDNSPTRLIGQNSVGACFLYTRKAYVTVGEYDPECMYVEDMDYWQRIAAVLPVSVIEDILYKYRWHEGALTSTMKRDTYYRNMEKMLLKNRPLYGKINWEQSYYYYSALSKCRTQLGEENPCFIKERIYTILFFFRRRLPNKMRKLFARARNVENRI